MVDLISQSIGHSVLAFAGSPGSTVTNFIFFKSINNFLRNEIDIMQWKLLSNAATVIGFAGIVILTVWIMFQGYRIVTGQSQRPMMALVGDSLKATLIVFIATTAAMGSSAAYWTLTDGMAGAITSYVTDEADSPFEMIDSNLAQMEGALAIIDSLDTGGNQATQDAKDRDRWFTGIGIAGPSVIAGAMLLLNKIAIALFVGFGPLFIMCLLFEQTKQLFSKWLLYGIGTIFSLAVLSVMVTIAMKMMKAITIAFVARYFVGMTTSSDTDGISSMALQQGGLGLLLSTLIVMAPPMAAAFFQGTLGQFASYSSFGTIGAGGYGMRQQALAQGRIPQAHAPVPSAGTADGTTASLPAAFHDPRATGGSSPSFAADTIKPSSPSNRS
ncbi:type IV secretion system protein [Luteibacter sp. Lutesp34]|uniref:type IV secretion system protein n=1 Tax=Luteibacter sp. Lutesp34 TaxID=3243030 RepID=UPI0039B68DCB